MSVGLIRPAEFRRLADLAYSNFGIHLPEKKRQLVTNKFSNTLAKRGFEDWASYIDEIENDLSGRLLLEFADRLTTNHTYFFREEAHFDILRRQILEPKITSGANFDGEQMRIWCAGCASGEEAYSLAITLFEYRGGAQPFRLPPILASDISFSALKKAKDGHYDVERLRNMPRGLRQKYFKENFPGNVTVVDHLRSAILFKRLNFMSEKFPFKKKFHAVFCRNVMIYFDDASKGGLISRLTEALEPGGLLFIGHSETISREHLGPLQSVGAAVYRKGGTA
ncbi:MAG: chemotaxis protein CheR [Spirochaetaceae bacterium]|nr:chemotaxis protein CheR [Spirochaetaceae bacterium]